MSVEHKLKMGLGEAIQRLIHVEVAYANSLDVAEHLIAEREMLTTALNQYDLDLGFDCNVDDVAEDVNIFRESASTGCCRINASGSRANRPTEGRVSRPIQSSRRK